MGIVGFEEGERKLPETANWEGEFGVEVERRSGEAAEGVGELGGEEELKGELGLAGAALGDELGDGFAGDAAGKKLVEEWAVEGELLGGYGVVVVVEQC